MGKAKALQVFYVSYSIIIIILVKISWQNWFSLKNSILYSLHIFLFTIYTKNTCLLYKISYLLCLRVNGHTQTHRFSFIVAIFCLCLKCLCVWLMGCNRPLFAVFHTLLHFLSIFCTNIKLSTLVINVF